MAQIIKHYQHISDREAFVTAEMVRNAYQGIGTEYETLLRAFDKDNEAFAKWVGKDRSLSTYQKSLTVRKYLAEFIMVHYKRTDIAMNELTEDFIRDYWLYLRNDGRRSKPSVWECSEVIFRDAENCRQADISHPKTSLHSEVETIRSRWSQIGKFIEEWNSWKVGITDKQKTKSRVETVIF